MARNITSNYETGPQLVTNGVKYTMYRVSIHQASDDTIAHQSMVAFGESKADFTGVAPGQYYAGVALSNEDGSDIGPSALSEDFEVPDDDMTLEVPLNVTVTVHPLEPEA